MWFVWGDEISFTAIGCGFMLPNLMPKFPDIVGCSVKYMYIYEAFPWLSRVSSRGVSSYAAVLRCLAGMVVVIFAGCGLGSYGCSPAVRICAAPVGLGV